MNRRKFIKNAIIGTSGFILFSTLIGGTKIIYESSRIVKVEENLGTSADLHSHAVVTYEGKPNLRELFDYCSRIGLDIIAFTNFADSRYEDLKKTAISLPKKYEFQDLGRVFYVSDGNKLLTVVGGQEVPTKQGHILTVGATSQIKNYKEMKETIEEAKDKDAIIIADHPFTSVWGGMGKENLEKHLDDWDGIEFNSQNITLIPFLLDQRKSNYEAEEFSKKYNIPLIATSDSHRLEEIARSYITFKEKLGLMYDNRLISKLRSIIKSKNFDNVKRYNTWGSFVSWAVPFQIKAKLGFYDKPKELEVGKNKAKALVFGL